METKFLNDGRKVAVVGKLNNQETIVQEVFVTTNGCEVPSGENFVVKSLHDEPVVSWHSRHKKEIEQSINYLKAEQDKLSKRVHEEKQNLDAIRAIVASSKKLADSLPGQDLDLISRFLTGTIEYLVVKKYDIEPPVKMIDEIIYWETNYGERKFDHIKLISVLGKSNGKISYQIHQYSDCSGSSTEVYPFTRLDDAILYIKGTAETKIDKGRLTIKEWSVCKNLGIEFSPEYVEKYRTKQAENIRDSLNKLEHDCLKKVSEIEKLKSDLNQYQ